MTYLLEAPERAAIEIFLQKHDARPEGKFVFEKILGFLSGVVITPGRFMLSDWLQPLLNLSGFVFEDIDDVNRFMGSVMPLFNRVNQIRINGENLCPFDLDIAVETFDAREQIVEWAIGLHSALTLRLDTWGAEKHEVPHVPAKLFDEAHASISFLWAVVEPQSIPDIVPDPAPFQRCLLKRVPGWTEDMQRTTWDDELMDLFGLFCVGRLKETMEALQRYSKAYDRQPSAMTAPSHPVSRKVKTGRNNSCPCGSNLKFKKCCGA